MNTWEGVGWLFFCLGVATLVLGLVMGGSAVDIPEQVTVALFWSAFFPWGITSGLCFVICVVALYVGRKQKRSYLAEE